MPLDGLLSPPRPSLLAEIIERHRVMPIPLDGLDAHKQMQLARFAPSFWHRHQAWLPVGLIGSVLCMALSGGLTNRLMPASLLPPWLTLFWLGVMALLVVFGVFRISAGARWEERWVSPGWLEASGVPAPIAAQARRLRYALPGSDLVLGELKQEEVVLDPYLLLERDGERVCLGIWDGEQIIACAAPV